MAEPQSTTELIAALQGVLRQVAEPTDVLKTILEQAVSRTAAERGLFVEVTERGELEYRVLHGFVPGHFEGDAGRFSRSLFARVLKTGDALLLPSVTDDPGLGGVESVLQLRKASILCMPIRTSGAIGALVHLEHRQAGHFTEHHRELLQALLEVAGPVLETLQAGRAVIRERDRLHANETRLRSEAEESRRQLATDWSFGRFAGRSPPVRELEATVRKVAATHFPVLLQGETGTGKGILARVIHSIGPRAQQPFVTVFCPSLEKGMVDAELFGHRRGAFTGAVADRVGKVQAADHGTLFLDEIGELPPEIQPKLLRLLQEQTYEPLGDAKERRADVRILAATNRDLEREVAEGRFRRDLFERLNYVPVRVPPLRERLEDLPLLLRHALDQHEAGRWIELAPEAERALVGLEFAWPGNVRHLEQLAARLSMRSGTGPVGAVELLALLDRRDGTAPPAAGSRDLSSGLPSLLEEAERSWLEQAIRIYPDLTRAELAGRLRISESALYKKLRQYGLSQR
jgi:Nif-specific regulatory protein